MRIRIAERRSIGSRTEEVRHSSMPAAMVPVMLLLSVLFVLFSAGDLRAQRTIRDAAGSEKAEQGKGHDSLMMVMPYEYIEEKNSTSYSDATITSNIADTLSGLVR